MSDIEKLRELIDNGYHVINVVVDNSNKAVITCTFSGMGNPIEGQIYFLISDDQLVITHAIECMKRVN